MREKNKRKRLPDWLKIKFPGREFLRVEKEIKELGLNTICVEAKCPNRFDCWQRKSATFLILGDVCTRNCRFCSVKPGIPTPPDREEARKIVDFVKKYELKYIVITSVTRDDLNDGGSSHFAYIIKELRQHTDAYIEVLIPDFQGRSEDIEKVLLAGPNVIAHNLETVERLTPKIRSKAKYARSLDVLRVIKQIEPNFLTKSGIMVGLGETNEEVIDTLHNLRSVGCDIVTIGQYLQPTEDNMPVKRFVTPGEFRFFAEKAKEMGFKKVYSGPFVRSSFHADEAIELLSSSK